MSKVRVILKPFLIVSNRKSIMQVWRFDGSMPQFFFFFFFSIRYSNFLKKFILSSFSFFFYNNNISDWSTDWKWSMEVIKWASQRYFIQVQKVTRPKKLSATGLFGPSSLGWWCGTRVHFLRFPHRIRIHVTGFQLEKAKKDPDPCCVGFEILCLIRIFRVSPVAKACQRQ